MDAISLRELVTVESAPAAMPSSPAKTYRSVPERKDSFGLSHVQRSNTLPSNSTRPSRTDSSTEDVEMSRPASPIMPSDGVEVLPSIKDPYRNRWRFAATCLMQFQNGLNDSAPGALIPYMEKHYNIGYAVVSLIFVGNAIGFIMAAGFIDLLREKLGRSRTLFLSQLIMVVAYIPIVCTAPFPVIVVSFFFTGFGMSINLAISNHFCGSMRNGTAVLGVMHGSYGVGGTVGPLIATSIVAAAHAIWSRFYFITLAMAVFNTGFASWAFVGYEKEVAPGATDSEAERQAVNPAHRMAGMFSALSSRVVLLGSLFIFAYQGAEVSISGWVISFLIATRNGDPSSVGYVTAGFWGGITLGRFLLSAPAHKIGEKRFVYCVVVGATVFELLVWLVPNVIGNAVAVAIVGLLLGPVYPCAASVFMRGMSRSEQVSGLGVISAFGSSGGAAAPFTTGILAQAVGTFVLHPIAIFLFGVMIACWYGLPHRPKRTD
ncbi:major facilitator superfamily transporter [Coniochaeta sp. 2T2.1]|nr:major facilitator superfamily transporter [Coniochaeta sp. 2T2.1]